MKQYLLFFLVLFIVHFTNSQESNKYIFQVLDKETKEAISFATILLKNENRGTHADNDGFFQLPKLTSTNQTFVVSAIGYYPTEFRLLNYSKNIVNKIYLTNAVYVLDNIILKTQKSKKKSLEPKEIVQKAIDELLNNYPTKAYSYIAHYRDYLQPTNDIYKKSKEIKENVKYLNLSEGIIEVFDSGFNSEPVSNNDNQIALYDFKLNDKYCIDTTLIIPYDNFNTKLSKGLRIESFSGNELSILSITNPVRNYKSHSISFMNTFYSDFVQNHYFKLEGKKISQKDTLYEISFRTKKEKTTKIHRGNGKIYISKTNFAIYKLNYYLFLDTIKKPKYSLNLEYKPIDDKMYLDYISFNNLLEIKNSVKTTLNYIGSFPENNTLIFKFNNPINYGSVKFWKRKINLFFDDKRLKIAKITIKNLNISNQNMPILLISIDNENVASYLEKNKTNKDFLERITVQFKNIKDTQGYLINKKPPFEFYQFRELFVQKIFTDNELPKNKTFIDKNKPLLEAKMSPFDFKNDFWIHTPLRIEE